MTQDEINLQEWRNPDNWSEGAFKFYFSKKDTRVFVPYRTRTMTEPRFQTRFGIVNLGHRRGAMWSFIFLLMISIFWIVAGLTVNFMEH